MVLHVIQCCLGYDLFERSRSAVHVSFLTEVNHVGDKWLTFRKATNQRQCSVTRSLRAMYMMGRRSRVVRNVLLVKDCGMLTEDIFAHKGGQLLCTGTGGIMSMTCI
ncbi:hypothetical protein VFPPC_16125 [Pochonia chlamydosporia 170]|uniref:Uncharacterized protein n=1 Tax=Pochonia chlamydosporia 170 TaxID=1380566 RepID=A0A179FNG1_METCM|nr:hypothetical protein VFPPC_16125 [Pochonia chlamydosporia 170]OAQ67156.1 hypothetical protein VFPPC_16125 [Pochonia chlamydosporia 170]